MELPTKKEKCTKQRLIFQVGNLFMNDIVTQQEHDKFIKKIDKGLVGEFALADRSEPEDVDFN